MSYHLHPGEVTERLNTVRKLHEKEKYDEELILINRTIGGILKSNFFPLLDSFLHERMNLSKQTDRIDYYAQDALIRISPYVRNSNPSAIYSEFQDFIKDKEGSVSIQKDFVSLFPISVDIGFANESVVAGQKATINLSVYSKVKFPVKFDSISIILAYDKEKEEIISISDEIELPPSKIFKFTKEEELPPQISKVSIKSIVFTVGRMKIHFTKKFSKSLNIIPDESACQIEYVMPKRCVIEAEIPLKVKLTAGDQKLENLSISFSPETPSIPVHIKGKCRDTEIGTGKTEIPDLDANDSVEMDLTVQTSAPVMNPVIMTVGFKTALSGYGKFTRRLPFDFQSPFRAEMRLYDSNFQELPPGAPHIESDSQLHIETALFNSLEFAVCVKAIESDTLSIDADLPVSLNPGEVYTFMATTTDAGQGEISITYDTEETGQCKFSMKTPRIERFARLIHASLDSPPRAVKHKEFEANIVIENMCEDSVTNDVAIVMMEVKVTPGFFITGPTKTSVTVFKGQKKVIPIRLLPLEAGSTTLPPIVITDTCSHAKPKILMAPIVVTFQ